MTARERLALASSAMRLGLWRAGAPLYNLAIREGVRRVFRPARGNRVMAELDVRIVGLLSTATGIGQSARLCIDDLLLNGHRVSTCNLSRIFGVDAQVPFDIGMPSDEQTEGLTIYHLNPPLMLLGMIASGPRRYYRGLNIGYWAWELPALPPEWVIALDYVDAVMTPSTFCRDVLQRYTTKPVLLVPHPVAVVEGHPEVRTWKGSRPSFRVLSIFNCGSSLYRKNPFAAIDAFKLACGDDMSAELILQVSDARRHKSEIVELAKRIGDAPNIRILDTLMTPDELDRLIRSADAYVSLHRAEGFGLTVAETIMRSVPVVVTGWSGTQDICTPDLAHVVDYRLVTVDDPHPAYCHCRDAFWAEPSIEDAARHLLAIRRNPAAALERAVGLRKRLIEHIDGHRYQAAIDALARGHLRAIGARRSSAQQTAV